MLIIYVNWNYFRMKLNKYFVRKEIIFYDK